MNAARARFAVTVKRCALVAAAWLLGVTCTVASPITIGTFEIQNDTSDPFFTGPTFVATNDSGLAGLRQSKEAYHPLGHGQNFIGSEATRV